MSLPDNAFPVSWDQFHRDARALAWRLAGMGQDFRAIVCISRGGLVPAAISSRELNIRLIETVCVASYHDYVNQGEMHLLKGITAELMVNGGEGVLVVDDLTDPNRISTGAYWYHDAQLRFSLDDKKKYDFYLGIDNVFDKKPPVFGDTNPVTFPGAQTSATTYDLSGRLFYAGVDFRF